MELAHTIINYLGGNKFIAMTGARNFVFHKNEEALTFQIMRNAKKVTHVRIKYTWKDLFNMSFYQITNSQVITLHELEDLYFDQLQETFTQHTGLYTSL